MSNESHNTILHKVEKWPQNMVPQDVPQLMYVSKVDPFKGVSIHSSKKSEEVDESFDKFSHQLIT